MRKMTKQYNDKSGAELNKDVPMLRAEIAKMQLERLVAPQKDVNLISKKKKQLAVLLTVRASKSDNSPKAGSTSGQK